ncbi:DUF6478 family protein [Aestuariivita boseongensis]|uniref:DUF6478 family protein n=1 Tax=Aestuariivita boseongensis TaxID=1470562 RepID=UPI00068219FB|nr:DUF6478 family protein [Aestuariivita boseongensis]
MAFQFGTVMDRFIHNGAIRWWRQAARQARKADLSTLRKYRQRARQLRTHLNEVIYASEERLALPLIGSNAFPKPFGTDWAWRPELWRGPLPVPGMSSVETKSMLGKEATLFHDCARSELTLRQVRNLREADLAPYGVRMDVFRFDGSFLSLVIDMPKESIAGLKKDHVIRVDTIVEVEKPIEIFARLNIKHGPNTEQFVRELPLHEENVMVEFDLAYSNLNEKRIEKAWLDIIFEGPEMNQVTLRDLTFSRRLRAAI